MRKDKRKLIEDDNIIEGENEFTNNCRIF